jgi:hypothetical protein
MQSCNILRANNYDMISHNCNRLITVAYVYLYKGKGSQEFKV